MIRPFFTLNLFCLLILPVHLFAQMPGETKDDALAILRPFVLEDMLTDSSMIRKNHLQQMAYVTTGHMKQVVFNKDALPVLSLKISEEHDTERTTYSYDGHFITRINTINNERKPVQQIVYSYDSTHFLAAKEVRHYATSGEYVSTYHTFKKYPDGGYVERIREQLAPQFVTVEHFDADGRLIKRIKLQGKQPYSVEKVSYQRVADTLQILAHDSLNLLPSYSITLLYDSLNRPIVVHANVVSYKTAELIKDRSEYKEDWYTLLIAYLPNGMPGRVFRDSKLVLQAVYKKKENK